MRLIGILCWYDEAPSLLAGCVSSLVRAGVDHLVAVDGAFVLYPRGRPSSGAHQQGVIHEVCRGAGIGCTMHTPADLYAGNEVEKRTLAFRLAEAGSTEDDWYLVIDADEIVTAAHGLRETLDDATRYDVAEVLVHDADEDPLSGYPAHRLFRALRGLHVHKNHYTYRAADGLILRGNQHPKQEPSFLLPGVVLEHRPMVRDRSRHGAKLTYYERRDKLGAETTC